MAANLLRSKIVAVGPDQPLFNVIRNGIPGTEMFAHDIPDASTWRIVTYLHGLARPGDRPPLPGDPVRGGRLFSETGCRGCHVVGGKGGFIGPDLSSIALQRTADHIRTSLLAPDASVDVGYAAVSLTTSRTGDIEGILKNEDSFSLQVLTLEGALLSIGQSDVQSRTDGGSPMSVSKLSAADLRDLLAFLDRQRRPFVPDNSGFGNY